MYPRQEPDTQYFSSGAYGSTVAKAALVSPQHARDVIDGIDRAPSTAMQFGTLWDTYLTGDRSSIIERPLTYTDAKTGEVKPWHHASAVCKAWEAQNIGKLIIKPDEQQRITLMDSRMPEELRELVGFSNPQMVYRFCHGYFEAQCKVDLLHYDEAANRYDAIIDAKTTSSKIEQFMNQSINYGYHVQAGWYRWIIRELTGELLPFSFLVTETVSPYRTVHFIPDAEWLAYGDAEAQRAVTILDRCAQSGNWTDQQPTTQTLSLPAWKQKGNN
jgi:hypothetical protein